MNIYLTGKKGLLGLGFLAVVLNSCGDTRQLTYLQGKFDSSRLAEIKVSEPVIRKGDLLSIIVYSDNPAATAIYNQSLITTANNAGAEGMGGGGSSSGSSGISTPAPSSPGYQVDENGNIQFQGLGLMHIEGLTKGQLRDSLDTRLQKYLIHPYYTIRFLNYRFTLLGEVNKPGLFSIPGEQINILQAMAMAGDLTFYGRRDNILIMRENNGKREWGRVDLTKPDILSSPYFYLQQNDLIYVEATRKKVAANDQVTVRNISIGATIASTLAIIYSIFKK